jgi:uncharacterized protein
MSGRPPWRITDTGLDLRIRLTPRAVHDLIDGVTETATGAAVRVWVRALPEAGRANDAVEGLVKNTCPCVDGHDVTCQNARDRWRRITACAQTCRLAWASVSKFRISNEKN